MGILGTSAKEEAQLRQAALNDNVSNNNSNNNNNNNNTTDRRPSVESSSAYTSASAYETAEESEYDDNSSSSNLQEPAGVNPEMYLQHTNPIKGGPSATHNPKLANNNRSNSHNNNMLDEEDNSVREVDAKTVHGAANRPGDEEEELNRQFTLERYQTNHTIEQEVDEDFARTLSHKSHAGEVEIKDLDWDSPSDPDNPQNWSSFKKWYITFTVAIVCLCVSLGSSLYVSGVPEIMARFGASQELCLSGLTFYLVGLALGPVLMAPLSEIIGRRPIYLFSFPVSMLFTMGIGLANNMRTILILRFFCGYIASPALSIAGGTISDIWGRDPQEMSIAVALFCVAPFLGPVIGPIVGGYAAVEKGWRWTMWVSLMFSGAILPFLLFCPETLKHIILARRAKKRGINLVKPKLTFDFIKKIISMQLIKPLKMLVVEPIVSLLSFYIAFIFAVLFGFFEAFPIIFRGVYHMSDGNSGLPFIAVGLGLIFGVVFFVILDLTVVFPKNPDGTRGKRDENGNIIWDAPETKLMVGKIGAVCLPIALFWMGWTGRTGSVHWMAPTAAGFPFGFGLILVFFSVVLYFSFAFPPLAVASALAANNLLRYVVASVFPLFTVQMYEKLNIGWASTVFAFIALAMVPLPFVFGYWGPGFRKKSQFGYAAYFKELKEKEAAAAAASQPEESGNTTAANNSSHEFEDKQDADYNNTSNNYGHSVSDSINREPIESKV